MDSGALFHVTYCKEELERFKLRSGKIRLADDKTLDFAGVRDVVLKTSFSTSWTLKVVSYISGLKRRLISVRQLDEECYHVHPEVIGSIIDGSGSATLWFGEAKEAFLYNVREDKETVEVDSVSTAYFYHIPYVPIGLRILKEEWRGKDTSLAHLKAVAQMKCDTAFRIQRVTRLSEAEISHLWTRFIEPENDSIVAEHGLSLEITQSLGGSLYTSEGSKNSGSFEDKGRSNEEYSKDGASSKEGGSETPQNQTYSLVRLPAGKKASQRLWVFKVKEEHNSSKKLAGQKENLELKLKEILYGLIQAPRLWVLIFVEDSWNEEPSRDVYQVGDEREIKVLHSFNWPLRELITEDGVLPKRGAIYRIEVRKFLAPQYDIVQGYEVKQSVAAILKSIFKKHGDIASERVFKTVSIRESILEMKSSKQTVNTISTMEAEFVALDKAAKEAERLRSFLKDMGEADVILVVTPFDPKVQLKNNKGQSVSQLHYTQVVGSLMYIMNYTRPDLTYSVSRLSRYLHNLSKDHWDALVRVLQYLKHTIDYGLHYTKYPPVLEGYCDANWISNHNDSKSISGYVFTLRGAVVSWKSSKQTLNTRSTIEAEFVALDKAAKEAEWLRSFLKSIPLWPKPVTAVYIHCNSMSALTREKNHVYNGKSRHIRRRHNTIKDLYVGKGYLDEALQTKCFNNDNVINNNNAGTSTASVYMIDPSFL
ncbi:hypothetical protein Tco_1568285 [Tanacetum coccineum]